MPGAMINGANTGFMLLAASLVMLMTPGLAFAGTAVNPSGAQGLVHGTATFFGKQLPAGVGCSIYAFGFTYVMLKVIDRITPVRVGAEAEEGLDAAMHGESAYALGV
jgi:ammonia channel protein AmtB